MINIATVNFISYQKQSSATLRGVISYVCQVKKTGINRGALNTQHWLKDNPPPQTKPVKLVSGINCTPESAYAEFLSTKESYNKNNGVQFYHYTQSFKDGENISPKIAHDIALKFAEKHYSDYEVLVATHIDNQHLHSHFIINSVSFETGKKLHQPPNTIRMLRQSSDMICKQYGLSILPTYTYGRSKTMGRAEKRAKERGNSWKFNLCLMIETAMKKSKTKADFIERLSLQGIEIKWTDDRKNITYTLENGKSVRDDRLYGKKFLKENMEKEFKGREQNLLSDDKTGWEYERDILNHTSTPSIKSLAGSIEDIIYHYEQAMNYDDEIAEITNLALLTTMSFVGAYLFIEKIYEMSVQDFTDENLEEIINDLKQEPENCIKFEDEQEQQGFTMTMM